MYNRNVFQAGPDDRGHSGPTAVREESPGSIGHGCRVVPGEGNFKESATEKKTAFSSERVRMKR